MKPRTFDKPVSEAMKRLNPDVFGPLPSEKLARETNPDRSLPDPKPQRHQAAALGKAIRGEEAGTPRATVRFTGYRVRPLDPDNFAGSVKDLLDGLRHAALIPGDEPWRIRLETEQVRVRTFAQEKTVIEIER